VPYAHLTSPRGAGPLHPDLNPSPPRLAINGVTRDVPAIPAAPGRAGESARRRAADDHEALYYPLPPVGAFHSADSSPVIPLSPDPFGRFSSSTMPPPTPIGAMERMLASPRDVSAAKCGCERSCASSS
jgi:hypothetical protein